MFNNNKIGNGKTIKKIIHHIIGGHISANITYSNRYKRLEIGGNTFMAGIDGDFTPDINRVLIFLGRYDTEDEYKGFKFIVPRQNTNV